MLSVGAYSFRHKARLAISLSWVAGYTNAITFLMLGKVVVAHVTGHVTQLGLSTGIGIAGWVKSDWDHTAFGQVGFFLYVVGSFYLGAVSSAAMIEFARRHKNPSKFTIPMAVEAVLLSALAVGIAMHLSGQLHIEDPFHEFWMVGVAAASMGLQNATVTRISGAVVRPTHLTGVVTDLGIETVAYVLWAWKRGRGRKAAAAAGVLSPDRPKPTFVARVARVWAVSRRHPSFLKLLLLGSVFSSFLLGTVVGTLAFTRFPASAMAVPVAFLLWIVWVDRSRAVAEVHEWDPTADAATGGTATGGLATGVPAGGVSGTPLTGLAGPLPPDLGVYRLAHARPHVKHDPPDFVGWVDGLPGHRRVVVLMLSPQTRLDANAALNLAAAVKRLRSARRDLVVAGVGPHQYKVLDRGGLLEVLHPENVTADVGPAVARAMALLADPGRDPALDGPSVANAPAAIA